MKALFTLFILLFFIQTSFSQNCIKGKVTDESNICVPYATITDSNGKGVVCDTTGNFELYYSSEFPQKICIQALGFLTDTIIVKDPANKIVVILKENKIQIDGVSVVHYQDIKEKSTVSTISIDKKEIEILAPQNISAVLQTKTGFTNRSGYQTPLTLRGMSGKRLLVLRNGLRRFSSYPSGYMSHTINVYDLERIDVEKGAASVIYGAGAMAGIINLVDKSPFKQEGLNAKLTTGYGTVNNEQNILACGGWSNEKLAVKSGVRYRSADDYKYPDGSIAKNSFYSDKDLFLSLGYQFSDKQHLLFTTDIHDGGPWGKPVGFNGSNYMRVQTQKERSNNYALQYNYHSNGFINNIEASAFISDENRTLVKNYYTAAGYMLSYVETTNFSDYYYGSRVSMTLKINDSYKLKTGTEFYSFHISTPTDVVDYIEGISFQNRVSHNARSYISGSFVEGTYTISNHFKFITDFRYDIASVFEGDVYSTSQDEEMSINKQAISGNIATIYRPGEYSKVKLNIARSFRMPETSELFADSYTSNGIMYANPNLKPEYCNSFDISYSYSSSFINLEVSPFLWLMDNMITKDEIKGMPGTNYEFVNIGKARLMGGEIVTDKPFNNLFSKNDALIISIGAAYLHGTDVTEPGDYLGNGTPLDYVPPFNLKSNLSYNVSIRKLGMCSLAFRSVYYSEQTRLGENPYATPSYWLFGTTVKLVLSKIKTKPTINIAINNLLNSEYYCYQSYLLSEARDFRVFLTFHFN